MALMWQNVRFLGQIENGLSSTPRVQKLNDGEEQPEHSIATSQGLLCGFKSPLISGVSRRIFERAVQSVVQF